MDWGALPLREYVSVGNLFAVKVASTAIDTSVLRTFKDPNVRLDIHITDNDRLIGYTLKARKSGKGPILLVRPMVLSLFYSPLRDVEKAKPLGKAGVIFVDSNIRLLSFGDEKHRDYMLILRSTSGK